MDIEILLEQEKMKALQVLKEYNSKYTSKNKSFRIQISAIYSRIKLSNYVTKCA